MSTPRTPPRLLRVIRTVDLSPQMRRITLGGPAMAGFPLGMDGSHIKLMLPQAHQNEPMLPTLGPNGPVWPPADQRPITRTYSVSRYHPESGELDVDFVLHGDSGPASAWALRAQPGDAIGVAGPAGPALFQPGAPWYLLIGDPSSLALLTAVLRALSADAQGEVLIEVPDEGEIQALAHPAGMRLRWLVRHGAPAGESRLLLDAVAALPWPATPSVTLAGESAQVVAIRDFLLQQRQLPRRQLYAVPYWRDCYTEEAYHLERHRIMDELDAVPNQVPETVTTEPT
ncbi:NADPH-dependent ferric siderophore reductase, contains FAD-binding and SIP domains [Andreprevotia lacus DSM 23236]|jgi:NADPH-dependent ferric siderophore reductase|uniref:NADPH-dependent ferric siderophore reductase, contains FAD-binding and SIP domains n=1 Tax=Andreprevotia lacus DSM 23236 TaxID=1121001 RepID=A0A1W1XPK6_9NEIS|nr:siderophore-interacting protein [Andreprevotia lacus]SMC25903.1 NADPH-dependent ferric siderophore reductase, contains FAD-binding and SIP domains [Andreprevotia lacus DSM 23236]